MILQDWWYTTLLGIERAMQPPLNKDIKADVVIVGAGAAGVSAAMAFVGTGLKVVVLEKNIFGGSSTGKSAGFLTPDSELELSQLLRRYGVDGARDLWELASSGVDKIVANVKKYDIDCDLILQDSLYMGNDADGLKATIEEVEARKKLGYEVQHYNKNELDKMIGSPNYTGAVRYSGTYGINALRYTHGIKNVLLNNGLEVYESSEVKKISGHTVFTHQGSVTAENIIFCADKLEPQLTDYSKDIFHAQTFLSISEPLDDADLKYLFPKDHFQCWDSDLVYSYFRLTGDNRLLLGGGTSLSTFSNNYTTSPHIINGVINKFKAKFPGIKGLEFIQYWPGLIDTTRDLVPTVVRDEKHPYIHFVLGCVGLPWATFCGDFAARHVIDNKSCNDHKYYQYLSADRNFFVPIWMENIIGKQLTFSINNGWAKYYQVDKNKPITFKENRF
ncbi:MAG TPA: FAD-binding oxidoreductase [Bacteroidia bacterium]|nr:FAD-binding oxidoreductase [Bacteroidia bacterium]